MLLNKMDNGDLSAYSLIKVITMLGLSGLPWVDAVTFNKDVVKRKKTVMAEPGVEVTDVGSVGTGSRGGQAHREADSGASTNEVILSIYKV